MSIAVWGLKLYIKPGTFVALPSWSLLVLIVLVAIVVVRRSVHSSLKREKQVGMSSKLVHWRRFDWGPLMAHRISDRLGKSFSKDSLHPGPIVYSAETERLASKCLDIWNRNFFGWLCTVWNVGHCLDDDVVRAYVFNKQLTTSPCE